MKNLQTTIYNSETTFSYVGRGLAGEVADGLRQRAASIRARCRSETELVIANGRDLLWAKDAFGDHGHWLDWLKAECTLKDRTAQRYMAAARFAEGKNDIVSFFQVGAIYELARKGTPSAVIDRALELARAGARLDKDDIDRLRWADKLAPAARDALLSGVMTRSRLGDLRRLPVDSQEIAIAQSGVGAAAGRAAVATRHRRALMGQSRYVDALAEKRARRLLEEIGYQNTYAVLDAFRDINAEAVVAALGRVAYVDLAASPEVKRLTSATAASMG